MKVSDLKPTSDPFCGETISCEAGLSSYWAPGSRDRVHYYWMELTCLTKTEAECVMAMVANLLHSRNGDHVGSEAGSNPTGDRNGA